MGEGGAGGEPLGKVVGKQFPRVAPAVVVEEAAVEEGPGVSADRDHHRRRPHPLPPHSHLPRGRTGL